MSIKDANEPTWQRPRYFVAPTPSTEIGPAMSDTIVGSMAAAVRDAWGIAPVLTAGTALGVAAAAGCGRYLIAKDEFTHFPLSLYNAMLSDPGTLKSSLLGALSRELKGLQADYAAEWNSEIASRMREAEALTQALEKVKRDMATAYAKGNETTDLEAHAQGLQMQLEKVRGDQFTAPFRPISFGSDSTPEAIVKRAATQGGRIALLSAEAGVLENLAGRYSEGNAKTEFLNSAFDGESYEGSRVGDDGRDIPNPWATLVLAIQPDALNIMLGSQTMRTRGFLQRWLLFHAPRGEYRPRMSMPVIDRQVQDEWDVAIADIWNAASWDRAPKVLSMTDEVKKHIEVFECERVAVAYAQAEEEGNALLMGWLGKIAMTTARVAGILTLLDDVPFDEIEVPVEVAAAEAAVEFANLALDHADYLFAHGPNAITRSPRYRVLEALVEGSVGSVGVDPDLDDDDREGSVGYVRVHGGEFSRRAVHRRFQDQGWCQSADDVEAVLLDLAALGWVQHLGRRTTDKGGRPRDMWAIHPDAITHHNAMTGKKEN
jgi:hypothetical protein